MLCKPRCFWCKLLMPSDPVAVEFFVSCIIFCVCTVVKGVYL
jgi:hypothetical protein